MIVQLRNVKNIFMVPELRSKVLFTFFVLAVFRFGVHIPIPGVNTHVLNSLAGSHIGTGFWAYIDLFSGGALRYFAIFALGMTPYINASLMMQILTVAVPSFEQLSKEGEFGRRTLNQYTRYLAIGISLIQGLVVATRIESYAGLALYPGWWFRISTMFICTIGLLFIMWLGEQINTYGVGNGSSLIIFAGIIARFPDAILHLYNDVAVGQSDALIVLFLGAFLIAVLSGVVFLEKGERRVAVHYARKVVGNKVYGGQNSYIPFKINSAGVVPVIFAGTMISTFGSLIYFLKSKEIPGFSFMYDLLSDGHPFSIGLNGFLIGFFAFFYTSVMFDPTKLADNIRKSGGFIPGIRPGRKTEEFFFYLLNRITLPGAIYLAVLAVGPRVLQSYSAFPVMFDGTSLLIVVGVALDLSAQIESYLIERKYEGFLSTGRLRSRLGR